VVASADLRHWAGRVNCNRPTGSGTKASYRNDWRSLRPPAAFGSAGQMRWTNRGTQKAWPSGLI